MLSSNSSQSINLSQDARKTQKTSPSARSTKKSQKSIKKKKEVMEKPILEGCRVHTQEETLQNREEFYEKFASNDMIVMPSDSMMQ